MFHSCRLWDQNRTRAELWALRHHQLKVSNILDLVTNPAQLWYSSNCCRPHDAWQHPETITHITSSSSSSSPSQSSSEELSLYLLWLETPRCDESSLVTDPAQVDTKDPSLRLEDDVGRGVNRIWIPGCCWAPGTITADAHFVLKGPERSSRGEWHSHIVCLLEPVGQEGGGMKTGSFLSGWACWSNCHLSHCYCPVLFLWVKLSVINCPCKVVHCEGKKLFSFLRITFIFKILSPRLSDVMNKETLDKHRRVSSLLFVCQCFCDGLELDLVWSWCGAGPGAGSGAGAGVELDLELDLELELDPELELEPEPEPELDLDLDSELELMWSWCDARWCLSVCSEKASLARCVYVWNLVENGPIRPDVSPEVGAGRRPAEFNCTQTLRAASVLHD